MDKDWQDKTDVKLDYIIQELTKTAVLAETVRGHENRLSNLETNHSAAYAKHHELKEHVYKIKDEVKRDIHQLELKTVPSTTTNGKIIAWILGLYASISTAAIALWVKNGG